MVRENGYYWIKSKTTNDWFILKWSVDCWWSGEFTYYDNEFGTIDERRIINSNIESNEVHLKAQKRALTIPVVMWRFCAYKTEKDYESGEHYFVKDFLDHTEMKIFSGKHSAKEKLLLPGYCSMYWKIETNVTQRDSAAIQWKG